MDVWIMIQMCVQLMNGSWSAAYGAAYQGTIWRLRVKPLPLNAWLGSTRIRVASHSSVCLRSILRQTNSAGFQGSSPQRDAK